MGFLFILVGVVSHTHTHTLTLAHRHNRVFTHYGITLILLSDMMLPTMSLMQTVFKVVFRMASFLLFIIGSAK